MNYSKIFLSLILLLFLTQIVSARAMDRLNPLTIESGDTWNDLDMFTCPKSNFTSPPNLLVGQSETDFSLAELDIDDDDSGYQCIDFKYNGQKILKVVPDTTLNTYYFTTYAWNGVYWYKLHEKTAVDSTNDKYKNVSNNNASSIARELALDIAAGWETGIGIPFGETDIRVTKIRADPRKLEELISAAAKPRLSVGDFALDVRSALDGESAASNVVNLARDNAFEITVRDKTEQRTGKNILDFTKYETFTKYGFSLPPITANCSVSIYEKSNTSNVISDVLNFDFTGNLDFQNLLNNCEVNKSQVLDNVRKNQWRSGEYTLKLTIKRPSGDLELTQDFKVVVSNLAGAAADQRKALEKVAAEAEANGGSLAPPLQENPTAKIIIEGIGEVLDGDSKIFGVGKGQPLTFNVEAKQSRQGNIVNRFDWGFYSINADGSETRLALPDSLKNKALSDRSSFEYQVPFDFTGNGITIKLKVSDDASRNSNYTTITLSVSPELTERVEGASALHTQKPGATGSEFFNVQLKATVDNEEFNADLLNNSNVSFKGSPPFSLIISFLQSKHPVQHSIIFNLGKNSSRTTVSVTPTKTQLPGTGGVNLVPVDSGVWGLNSSDPSNEKKCISTPTSNGRDALVRCEIPVSRLNGVNVGDINRASEFEILMFSYNDSTSSVEPNSELRFTVKLNEDTSKTINFTDEIRPRGKGLLTIDPTLLGLVVSSSGITNILDIKGSYIRLKDLSNLKIFKLTIPAQLKGRTSYLDYRVDPQDQIRNDRKAFLVAQGDPVFEIPLEQLIGNEADPNNPNKVDFTVGSVPSTSNSAFVLENIERNDESNPRYSRQGPFYYVAVLRFADLQPMYLIFSFEKGEKIYQ